MAGIAPEKSQFDVRQFDSKMNKQLSADTQDFFTSHDEVYDNFDSMGLQENLVRGIYAYGFEKPPDFIPRRDRKRKKASVLDIFGQKFDQYLQIQKNKAENRTRMMNEIVETQRSFQMKIDLEILKMKPDDYTGVDLDIYNAIMESVRNKYRKKN